MKRLRSLVPGSKPAYEDDSACLVEGDCISVLKSMPSASIDTIITDPPYHLTSASLRSSSCPEGRPRAGGRGFLGKTWDGGSIAFDPKLWSQALRVAKPGAVLLAFGGPRTFHRMACAIEDGGWIIRDCLLWLYGSGFPKSHNIGRAIDKMKGAKRTMLKEGRPLGKPGEQAFRAMTASESGYNAAGFRRGFKDEPASDEAKAWEGWGTTLKPAWEPIILAMKPVEKSFASNALAHGVAGLHVDGARVGSDIIRVHRYPCSDGIGPFTAPGQASSSHARQDYGTVTHTGRWPANLVLAHLPSCRPTHAEQVASSASYPSPSQGGWFGRFRGRSERSRRVSMLERVQRWACDPACPVGLLDDSTRRIGGASRFFYCAKASTSERETGLPEGTHNTHPTVKPLALMEWLCRLTATPSGGIVLDPFAGSGTTLLACRKVGRPSIGIDRDPEYIAIARERLKGARARAA